MKCIAARLSNFVTEEVKKLRDTVERAKNKVKVVEKLHKTVKEDMSKAMNAVVEKAYVLEGVEGQLREANYLRESVDIRKQIEEETETIAKNAVNSAVYERDKNFMVHLDKHVDELVVKRLRTTQHIGLPKLGGLNAQPAIMSAEDVEQDKKMEDIVQTIISKASKHGLIQLEEAEKKSKSGRKRQMIRKALRETRGQVQPIQVEGVDKSTSQALEVD